MPITRRSFHSWLCGGLAASLGCAANNVQDDRGAGSPPPRARLGINLAGPADWSTELPFVNVFRLSRVWISQREGASFGEGPKLALDPRGWVTKLEPNCWAESPLCTIEGGHYPSGKYTALYAGKGKLDVSSAGSIVSDVPGKMVFRVDAQRGGFFLKIKATDPADYVRDIRVLMPGHVESYQKNPWNPRFLERWKGIACLRFMDFMKTNNSTISAWSDRPKLTDATFTKTGVPVELLVDLANRLEADAWFCMPHEANFEYLRGFAQIVKKTLAPNLKAYVEYSNEVWNSDFKQHKYAAEMGVQLGLAPKDKPWQGAWRYTAVRSKEIFQAWEGVFGGRERLVRVAPTQSVNTYLTEQILKTEDMYRQADVLAIAPYFGPSVPREGKLSAKTVAKWTPDQLFDYMEKTTLPETIKEMSDQKAIADKYNLKLVAYEAGQHLAGIQGAENNDELTKLFAEANNHPRMGRAYERYLDGWKQAGGDLLCHFSSTGKWTKWGNWGLTQHLDDDAKSSPKYMAVMNWAKRNGQAVMVP